MRLRTEGGPAFPRPFSVDTTHGTGFPDGDAPCAEQDGMTLRDHFAGEALAKVAAPSQAQWTPEEKAAQAERIAADAYRIADAMVRERDRLRKADLAAWEDRAREVARVCGETED